MQRTANGFDMNSANRANRRGKELPLSDLKNGSTNMHVIQKNMRALIVYNKECFYKKSIDKSDIYYIIKIQLQL